MQTDPANPPLPLRSGQLDIKDGQCVDKMIGVKFHTISYGAWAPQAPERAHTAQWPSKVAIF